MALFLALALPVQASEKLAEITVRDGVTLKFIENVDAGNTAPIVILMIGGDGLAGLDGWAGDDPNSNFLTRVRAEFAKAGFVTALPDAPSDRQRSGLGAIRRKPIHARDIGKLIEYMKNKSRGPVFIVGTSKGTISAVTIAAFLPAGTVQGIVLTSSMTQMDKIGTNGNGPTVAVAAVKVPVLLLHHKFDACSFTAPGEVPHLAQALSGATSVTIRMVEGGAKWRGDPCHPFHAHGFPGIESKVLADIAAWIKTVAAGKTP